MGRSEAGPTVTGTEAEEPGAAGDDEVSAPTPLGPPHRLVPGGGRLPPPALPGPRHPGGAPHARVRGLGPAERGGLRLAAGAAPVDRAGRPGGHGRGAAGGGPHPPAVPAAGGLRPGGRRAGRGRRPLRPARVDRGPPLVPPGPAPPGRGRRVPEPRLGHGPRLRAPQLGQRVRAPTRGAGRRAVVGVRAQPDGLGGGPPPRGPAPALGDRRARLLHGLPVHGLPGPAGGPAPPRAGPERGPAGAAAARAPAGHPGQRRAAALLRADERRARAHPGRLGHPPAHRPGPGGGGHLGQPLRRVPRGVHRVPAGRDRGRSRRGGGRHPRLGLPRALPPAQPAPPPGPGHRAQDHGRGGRERLPGGVAAAVRGEGAPRPPVHLRRLRRPPGHPRAGAPALGALGPPGDLVVLGQPCRLPLVAAGVRLSGGVAPGRRRMPACRPGRGRSRWRR